MPCSSTRDKIKPQTEGEVPRRNYFCIEACLTKVGIPRYTPVGKQIIEVNLSYSGQVFEADRFRSLNMDISAIVVGDCCASILNCRLDECYCFIGFLAPRKRGASQLIFHVQKIRLIGVYNNESI